MVKILTSNILLGLLNNKKLVNQYLYSNNNIVYSNPFIDFNNDIPLLFGTWMLRYTNDRQLENTQTFLEFNHNKKIKLKTIYQDGVIGKKISRIGYVKNIKIIKNDINVTKTIVSIQYEYITKYSFSIFGIKIPEIKNENKYLLVNQELSVNIFEKTIIFENTKLPIYYIFDLQIGKIKLPFVETYLNTFIFTQFISFFFNIILANILHINN
jgi:hypothetical protein